MEGDDVLSGKLVSLVSEQVTRRGGKLSTTVVISRESAKALCKILKPALKDMHKNMRKQRLRHWFMNVMFFFIYQQGLTAQTR